MKTRKFYAFIEEISGNDKILAEAVIKAHRKIFKNTEVLEEGIKEKLAAAATVAGLAGAGAGAEAKSPKERAFEQFTNTGDVAAEVYEKSGEKQEIKNKLEKSLDKLSTAAAKAMEREKESLEKKARDKGHIFGGKIDGRLKSYVKAGEKFNELKSKYGEKVALGFQSRLIAKVGGDQRITPFMAIKTLQEKEDSPMSMGDIIKFILKSEKENYTVSPPELSSLIDRLDQPFTLQDAMKLMKSNRNFTEKHAKILFKKAKG